MVITHLLYIRTSEFCNMQIMLTCSVQRYINFLDVLINICISIEYDNNKSLLLSLQKVLVATIGCTIL